MKIEKITCLIAELSAIVATTNYGTYYDDRASAAIATLQKIAELKTALRFRFDPDKVNELYEVIEGTK